MRTKCINFFFGSLKTAMLILVILSLSSMNPLAGKGKTNFTGKWSLDESKSTISQGGFGPAKTLNITQEGNTLKVERTQTDRNGVDQTNTLQYTLDGIECTNSNERRTSKSVLNWSEEGKVLTINTTSKSERNGETFESTSIEIWKLDADGKSLVIDQTVNSSRGERKATLVYKKN